MTSNANSKCHPDVLFILIFEIWPSFQFVLFQLLTAFFIDFVFKLTGQKQLWVLFFNQFNAHSGKGQLNAFLIIEFISRQHNQITKTYLWRKFGITLLRYDALGIQECKIFGTEWYHQTGGQWGIPIWSLCDGRYSKGTLFSIVHNIIWYFILF